MTHVTSNIEPATLRHPSLAGGLSGGMIARAVCEAFVKLDPRHLLRNPVIFVTWIVALLATVSAVAAIAAGCTTLCVPHHVPILEGEGRIFADTLEGLDAAGLARLVGR